MTRFLNAIFFLHVVFVLASAQPYREKSVKDIADWDVFSVNTEKFSVALPTTINGNDAWFSKFLDFDKPNAQYNWFLAEGVITITHKTFPNAGLKTELDRQKYAQGIKSHILEIGKGRSESESSIKLGNFSGYQMVFATQGGSKGLSRTLVSNNEQYSLLVISLSSAYDPAMPIFKVLDSFRLITDKQREEIVARKTVAASTLSLPQVARPDRAASDAVDEGLKGNVMVVVEEREPVNRMGGRTNRKEIYYDLRGDRVKEVIFDYQGNPAIITFYGYIDGNRVSKVKHVGYDYDPLSYGESLSMRSARDPRYHFRSLYAYNENRLLKEQITYQNNGALSSKFTYSRTGGETKVSNFGDKDELIYSASEITDQKGNITERRYIGSGGQVSGLKTTYKYEAFDAEGNWTKRRVDGQELSGEGRTLEISRYEYRNITYHK